MVQSIDSGIVIDVRVIPRAGRSELAGVRDDRLLVRLHAPPVDGAANAELTGLIAAALDVPKRAVTIVAGERSRQKRVRVMGVDSATAESRLLKSPRSAGTPPPRDTALKGPRYKARGMRP